MAPWEAQDSRNLAERSDNSSSGSGLNSSCWWCLFFKSSMQTAKSSIKPDSASSRVTSSASPEAALPQQQLQEQQQQLPADCLGCRLTGLMLGLGGGGFVSSRLFEDPRPRGAHRYSLIGVSLGLFALGIGRALGF